MTDQPNALLETYAKELMTEECAEAIQMSGKWGRFGPDHARRDGLTARRGLSLELGDVLAAIDYGLCAGILDASIIIEQREKKFARLTDPAAVDDEGRRLAPELPTLDHRLSRPTQPSGEAFKRLAAKKTWIDCPLCGSTDTRCETDDEGYSLIFCVNHACPSNTVATRPGADEGEEQVKSKGMDEAADFCIKTLAKALGVDDWQQADGSETWDGDVAGTIYNVLRAARVYDDEDGRVARLEDAQPTAPAREAIEAAANIVNDAVGLIGPKLKREIVATILALALPSNPGEPDAWMFDLRMGGQWDCGLVDTQRPPLDHPDARNFVPLYRHPPAASGGEVERHPDAIRLDALRDECWDLRCFSVPTGGDDADVAWKVVGHWMAEPHERTIAEGWSDDPRVAIDAALSTHAGNGGQSEGGEA